MKPVPLPKGMTIILVVLVAAITIVGTLLLGEAILGSNGLGAVVSCGIVALMCNG
jgi:hypothetical protein